jgi:asparagine synthase (glutamine-hydrolysing)
MCGLTGIFSFNESGKKYLDFIGEASRQLSKRGPDAEGFYRNNIIALAHRRLSILDLSEGANQPMFAENDRYVIVFNGEIFNYLTLKNELEQKGIVFKTTSDTEVLLHLYILEGIGFLNKLNGFFAFAIYDSVDNKLFVARDRFGIKPLNYAFFENRFVFGSEMKAVNAFKNSSEIDYESLFQYLQFNYTIAPDTIYKNVKKLLPGHYILVENNQLKIDKYYHLPHSVPYTITSKPEAEKKLYDLLEDSVKLRLMADVPVGTFLSGGLDSSIVTALAALNHKNLNTFSIGFSDYSYFDETYYANLVAKKYATNHHVFSLSEKDLLENIQGFLDYIDEPFADSSAFAVYVLCKETQKHVKVALSGDGADEIFGGYNKYSAENMVRNNPLLKAGQLLMPFMKALPSSRENKFGNMNRQVQKLVNGASLSAENRYWSWCSLMHEKEAFTYLSEEVKKKIDFSVYKERKNNAISYLNGAKSINDVLYNDTHLVLPNDMLTKVDSMSMANSIEVRVPFLDYRVVEFAFNIPDNFKIEGKKRKAILIDTFAHLLPSELLNRPKKGFEIPVANWLRGDLSELLFNQLLEENFVKKQGIFDFSKIKWLKTKLMSNNPADTHAQAWALLIFQNWYKKYINNN